MEVAGMTLSCQELVELVTEYLEGSMEPATRARFEQHLLVCDGCGLYLAQMRRTLRATGTLRERDVAPDSLDVLRQAFRSWKLRAARG
ncbi:MAG: zf-HC2 domain-containing protein [Deltaproteobacteria bacterium]|nr:zf-HC2 domain-containing protein [Deltaproteobacteria bacterium]